jgi:hypothetical protein
MISLKSTATIWIPWSGTFVPNIQRGNGAKHNYEFMKSLTNAHRASARHQDRANLQACWAAHAALGSTLGHQLELEQHQCSKKPVYYPICR